MKLLDADATDAILDQGLALAAAREAARVMASKQLDLSRAEVGHDQTWFRVLLGALPELDLLGYKAFGGVRGSSPRFLCHLFRLSTGEPLAIVDARQVTKLRTAALASLAVQHAIGDESVGVGIVGSGGEARQGLRLLTRTCVVDRVRVFSPRPASRSRFAEEMSSEFGVPVVAVDSPREAFTDVEVGYSATTSRGQVVYGTEDVQDLRMLCTIGSTTPSQREVDGGLFHACGTILIDTPDALVMSGDVLAAQEDGGRLPEGRVALLGDYLDDPPSSIADGLLVYKSIGSAEQDLVLAYRVYEAAVERGLGRLLADPTEPSSGGRP